MKKIIGFVSVLTMSVLAGCNILSVETENTYTLDASELDVFTIEHDAGDVEIVGVEGIDEINVVSTFIAKGEDQARAEKFSEENLFLSLEDGVLKSKVNREAEVEQGFIDLVIEMPSDLALSYKQNEGELIVSSLRSPIKLQHGSGPMFLNDIKGDIQITDGAGNVTLDQIQGEVSIANNAGTTSVVNSSGSLEIVAGSGAVEVEEYEGDIAIRNGRGGIRVNSVNGDVTVIESQSETIVIEDVSGVVTQP